MTPTIGRIVHYALTEKQAQEVNRRRVAQPHLPEWPAGAQAHIGNPVCTGSIVPMIVTAVWPNEFGPDRPGINGQALLDGGDSLWVTSVAETPPSETPEPQPGCWVWPPKV